MKQYILLDKDKQWRVSLIKPKWRNRSYGFEWHGRSMGICAAAAHHMVRELGHDPAKFKVGEYLECDVS